MIMHFFTALSFYAVLVSVFVQIEECVVCSDKKASVLFKPCGHMCACESQFYAHLCLKTGSSY